MQKLLHPLSIFIASALLLLLIGATLFFAPIAHAARVDLSCTGTNHITYSPGLTSSPRSVTITEQGSLTSCLVSSDSTIPSGSYTFSGRGPVSCVFSSAISTTATYHWKNGKTSTLSYTSAINVNASATTLITDTGIITAGEFQGDNIVETDTFNPPTSSGCSYSRLNASDGTVLISITNPL